MNVEEVCRALRECEEARERTKDDDVTDETQEYAEALLVALPVSLAKVADHLKAVKIYRDNGRQWSDWREVENTFAALLSDGRES